MSETSPEFTVVVPMKNEASNVPHLAEALAEACADRSFQAIFVDDGSTDDTAAVIDRLGATYPWLSCLRHDRSGGQSAAVHSGVGAAAAPLIATMDGDGQNPPLEIPRLIDRLHQMPVPGLVAGQRVGRQDTLSKRWASTFANGLRGWMLNDGTRDTGCGLKAFPRDAFLSLPYFDHMHRYLPALFKAYGYEVAHLDVSHAGRFSGASNYTNLGRAIAGLSDLFGVMWLIRRAKKARPQTDDPT